MEHPSTLVRSGPTFRTRAVHSAARSPARPPFRAIFARNTKFRSTALTRSLRSTRCISAALGFRRNAWLAQVYGENLTDTRAELYANHTEFYKAVTLSRPRTMGLRFSYKFSGR